MHELQPPLIDGYSVTDVLRRRNGRWRRRLAEQKEIELVYAVDTVGQAQEMINDVGTRPIDRGTGSLSFDVCRSI